MAIFLNALQLFQSQNPPRQAEARDENIISLFRLVSKLVIGAETITDSLESASGRTSPCLLGPAMEKYSKPCDAPDSICTIQKPPCR